MCPSPVSADSEARVLDAAYDLTQDRAALAITHRLIQMEKVNEILDLN